MIVNYKFLLCLGLCVINLIVLIVTCSLQNWTSQNGSKMNISACSDCEGDFEGWSWECFAHYYCDLSYAAGYCDMYTKGYESSYMFLAFELLSLLMCILITEKLAIASFCKDFGHIALFYVYSVTMLLSHLTAISLFFGFSSAVWSDCTTSTDTASEPDICVEEGPVSAIVSLFLMAPTVALIIIFTLKRKTEDENISVGVELGRKTLTFSTRACMLFVLLLLLISMMAILIGTSIRHWIWRDTDSDELVGSLLRCDNCHYKYEWFGFDCLAGLECNDDEDSDECKTYRNLSDASFFYLFIEVCVFCLFVLHIQSVTAIIGGRDYGFPAYPIGGAILQVVAVAGWFALSGASYTAQCEDSDEFQFCSGAGPSIIIGSCVLMVSSVAVFCIVYWRRGNSFRLGETVIPSNTGTEMFSIDSPKATIKT